MKKLVAIILATISPAVLAAWSGFAHVIPGTESEYQVRVEFSKIGENSDPNYRIRIPSLGYPHRKAWLVLTARKLSSSGHELRAYLWWRDQPKERVISILELKPKGNEEGMYYEQLLTEYEAKHGYIYVDYPNAMLDGGYYYSIDLRAYLSGMEASANK
jgi:hypothetical protein